MQRHDLVVIGKRELSRHLLKALLCRKHGFDKLFSCLDETLFSKKTEVVTCRTLEPILFRKEELTDDLEVIQDISDFITKKKSNSKNNQTYKLVLRKSN